MQEPDTKGHTHASTDMKCPEEAKPLRQEAELWLPGAECLGEGGATASGCTSSFWGNENILELERGAGCENLKMTALHIVKR